MLIKEQMKSVRKENNETILFVHITIKLVSNY